MLVNVNVKAFVFILSNFLYIILLSSYNKTNQSFVGYYILCLIYFLIAQVEYNEVYTFNLIASKFIKIKTYLTEILIQCE